MRSVPPLKMHNLSNANCRLPKPFDGALNATPIAITASCGRDFFGRSARVCRGARARALCRRAPLIGVGGGARRHDAVGFIGLEALRILVVVHRFQGPLAPLIDAMLFLELF